MSTFVRTSSDAVLVFARPIGADLTARRLHRRLSPLLRLPRLSPAPGEFDVHVFSTCDLPITSATTHRQQGATFAARLDNAVATLTNLGYRRIVIVGRDCPQLSIDDVRDAYRALDLHRLVLGPDHRGGCWLIGLHASDNGLLHGIRWQCDLDRDALIERAGADATLLLQTRIDIDTPEDLRLLVRCDRVFAELVRTLLPRHTIDSLDLSACLDWLLHMIRHLQTPPPGRRCPSVCHA